jgi:uncharacterized repeat protein (TIGR01451 family)
MKQAWWPRVAAVVVSLTLGATDAPAAGTRAGTSIDNTAVVTFRLGGTDETVRAPAPRITVAEVVDLGGTALAATTVVQPGATGRAVAFRLANLGNGIETVRLELQTALAGDQFDPVAQSPALYLDTDGSLTLTAADLAYTPGVNDPALEPDATAVVFAVLDVPPAATESQRGRVQVVARSASGTAAPGTVYPGRGDGGGDALLGPSGGQATLAAELLVSGWDVAVAKTARVVDAAGGGRAEPGARIEYELTLTVNGSGTAANLVLTDPIPAATTFVAGSLVLDGTPQTDAADADASRYVAAASRVEFALGDVPAGTSRVARFAVTVN